MRNIIFIALAILFVIFFSTEVIIAGSSGRFGVIVGGQGKLPNLVNILEELEVSWVRINNHMDGTAQDISRFLDTGINVVITFSNEDPANLDTTYGSQQEHPRAGYPFKSKEVYQNRIRETLQPLIPYLKGGRQIMVQCENEITDASINPKAAYWRGTIEQYLTQLDAFYEVVKSIDPSIKVVLTSFASETLSAAINIDNPRNKLASSLVSNLLKKGKYDAADLHFYGCVEDIATKVNWVKERMPAGKIWISTENGGPDYRCATTSLKYDENPAEFERIQAQQVSGRLQACAQNGGSVCLWFSLFDLRGEVDVFKHLGLISISGLTGGKKKLMGLRKKQDTGNQAVKSEKIKEKLKSALHKKPAYDAFKSFVAAHE